MERPSRELIRHFARDLYSSSFTNAVEQEFRPIVRRTFLSILSKDNGDSPVTSQAQGQRNPTVEATEVEDENEPAELTLRSTADPDILQIPVFATYKGHSFQATLLYDTENWRKSLIEIEGKKYKPSPAALIVVKRVNPKLKNQPSGWPFWKLIDPQDNGHRAIKDLNHD